MGVDAIKDGLRQKIIAALQRAGFQLQAGDSAQEGLSSEHDPALSALRGVANVVATMETHFDHDAIQRHLEAVAGWASAVCFRYVLGQPVIVALVDADRLTEPDCIAVARRFDKVIVEMLEVTANLNVSLRPVKLGSTGILLFMFREPGKAAAFLGGTQKRCKFLHFWKKTWVLPWVIDVPGKTASGHRGLPYFMSVVLNLQELQKRVFADA